MNAICGQIDCVERRELFEQAHPEVTIVTPPKTWDRWRAIVPAGSVPGEPDTTTVGALDLCRLMDELYRIFPAEGPVGP